MKAGKIVKPKYYVFRMLIIPILFYTTLNSALLMTLFLGNVVEFLPKYLPQLELAMSAEESGQELDFEKEFLAEGSNTEVVEHYFFLLLIITGGAELFIVLFNLPFAWYFSRLRRKRETGGFLRRYVRQFLVRTPFINTTIFGLSFLVVHLYLIAVLIFSEFTIPQIRTDLQNLLAMSAVSSILLLLFIYFWQKYRVQFKYLEHVFSGEELRERNNCRHFLRIQRRLLISSIMTTFLPLVIVFYYIYLSIQWVDHLSWLNAEETNLLLGGVIDNLRNAGHYDMAGLLSSGNWRYEITMVPYIDVIGVVQVVIGISSSIVVALFFLFFIVKWTNYSLVLPLQEVLSKMKKTAEGQLDSYALVRTDDEVGELTEGYNRMLKGLQEREQIKNLFGQYLTQEVSEQILNGKVDLEGNLYQASILFADVRNFTSISEQMDPKSIVAFLNEYFNEMIEVIIKYDGIIDKFMGDGILCVFGLPLAYDDHADKAYLAAREMQERVSAMNQRRQEEGSFPFEIGIGIHTGPVVAGNLGNSLKLEYTVIGDTVNMASRIESLTKEFQALILVSRGTHNAFGTGITGKNEFETLENVKIRGKKELVTLYKPA